MRLSLLISLLTFSALSWGQSSPLEIGPDTGKKFCSSRVSTPRQVQSIVSDYNNQLAFENQGGVFGAGVCWWHSRFTRAAAYLAVFDPKLNRPTPEEAKTIIDRLRHRKGITLIPGYRNLREFSRDYANQIQSKLNDWQKADGIQKVAWIKGLSGKSEVEPENLSAKMDELYERISNGEVVYQKLQMPSVVAHAWLVTGMMKIRDGYQISVVDSNVGNDSYIYRSGTSSLYYPDYGKFVPYTGEINEEKKLRKAMTEFCENI